MDRLKQIEDQIQQQTQPPVDRWAPDKVGDIDIRIDDQAVWYHEGEQIGRQPLVRLFASILWFESGKYYLVTPVEKLAIQVADVPFLIQQAELVDDHWVVTTNTQENIVIGQTQPVELRDYQGVWVPYVRIRYDLWARVNRSIYVQWVNQALANARPDEPLRLTSGEYQFDVAR